jgi:hypothetical protein
MSDFKYVEPKCNVCKKVINFSHINRDCNLPHHYHAGCHSKLVKFLDLQRNPVPKPDKCIEKIEVVPTVVEKVEETNEISKDKQSL